MWGTFCLKRVFNPSKYPCLILKSEDDHRHEFAAVTCVARDNSVMTNFGTLFLLYYFVPKTHIGIRHLENHRDRSSSRKKIKKEK